MPSPSSGSPGPLKRAGQRVLGTWLAGLLALLPLLLTVTLLVWAAGLVHDHMGPGSLVGRLLSGFGARFTDHPALEYLVGALILAGVIYPLGLLVRSGFQRPLAALAERAVRRIPVVGSLYNLAERFVGLLDQKQDADIGAMRPVWCRFGGDGVAVLGLLANPEPILIGGQPHLAVLVPTAPVPIGGGLLYVPEAWVSPAAIGVDTLSSVYLSMGIVAPVEPGSREAEAGLPTPAEGPHR